MKKIVLLALTFLLTLALAASASAYLHVANAQNYARAHVWRTFCNYNCLSYPSATGWYSRINDNYVRVEIVARKSGYGTCYRVFAVRGNDGSEYITTDGSAPYYSCQ